MTPPATTNTQSTNSLRINYLESDLGEIKKFVEGNGTPGAKVRLASLEDATKSIKEDIADIKSMISRLTALAVTVLGAGIIWFLFTVLPAIIKTL